MPTPITPTFNALIRTHHITSRKKVAHLRKAAHNYACYVLLRSGGSPGIMYCEGSEHGVKEWVNTVQRLRYKDYQLVSRPAELAIEGDEGNGGEKRNRRVRYGDLDEVDTVKELGKWMEERGVWAWWRKGMGYVND